MNPLVKVAKTIGSVFNHRLVVSAHVPTYGSPWGLVLASDEPIDCRPDPDRIDQQLQLATTGAFRMFDGQTLLGLLQTPKYVRDRILNDRRE